MNGGGNAALTICGIIFGIQINKNSDIDLMNYLIMGASKG